MVGGFLGNLCRDLGGLKGWDGKIDQTQYAIGEAFFWWSLVGTAGSVDETELCIYFSGIFTNRL